MEITEREQDAVDAQFDMGSRYQNDLQECVIAAYDMWPADTQRGMPFSEALSNCDPDEVRQAYLEWERDPIVDIMQLCLRLIRTEHAIHRMSNLDYELSESDEAEIAGKFS